MSKEPEDFAREHAAIAGRHEETMFLRWYEVHAAQLESPIERILLSAMMCVFPQLYTRPSFRFEFLPYRDSLDDPPDGTHIWPQTQIEQYRVDFLITCRHVVHRNEGEAAAARLRIGAFAIECDGHDFHERSKEQAARDRSRDRALTVLGVTTIRFTGSEIYRDPTACAVSIVSIMDSWAKRWD